MLDATRVKTWFGGSMMLMQRTTTTLTSALLALAVATPALAFDFSDTEISYSYGWAYKEPSVGANIPQNNLYLTHVDGYALGTNFISIDYTKWTEATGNDANCVTASPGCATESGNAEFYGVYRTDFSLDKITKSSMFSWGPFKDIAIEGGIDLETQDSTFAAEERKVVFGPQFAINIPKGFWNISLHVYKEWGNNGFAGQTNFDATPEMETQWLFPFQIGIVPINFTGFLNITGPKGYGRSQTSPFGPAQTRTEILAHPKFLADVGSVAFGTPGKLEAGIGFEYWLNKFGDTTSGVGGGTHQRALFFEVGYHF